MKLLIDGYWWPRVIIARMDSRCPRGRAL